VTTLPDNVEITSGTGTNVAADEIGGVKYQRVKIALGADGAWDGDLAPGAAAAAESLPITASTEDVARTGSITETAPASDTASSGLNGRLQRIAQRITSLIALVPASLGQKAMAASMAVVVASDQSAVPVSGTITASGTLATNPQWHTGAAWADQQGVQDVTLLASAARTATTATADQTNTNWRGVILFLNITVASGTGGLQPTIQMKDSISGNYRNLVTAPTAIIATGQYVFHYYPGVNSTNLSQQQVGALQLPRVWRINMTAGDSSSYTYSLSASMVL
jgi:hypothetical protein